MNDRKPTDRPSHGIVLAALLFSMSIAGVHAADAPAAKSFPTPLAAADALITAASQAGDSALLALLGPDGKEIVASGDAVGDRFVREVFLAAAKEKTSVLSLTEKVVFLLVGADEWPFPVPIVRGPQGWFWDAAAGKEEVISRRIGRNELMVIASCRAFVEAQREYALKNPAGAGTGVYAQKVLSSEGKRDGLYWPAKEGEAPSPLGPMAALATLQGYSTKPSESGPKPFHGYLFKILTAQGKDAPGGAKEYLKDGKMTGGFALVAWPAQCGVSGIMTFQVNQAGIVFEKDLGPKTAEAANALEQFNPDTTWKPAKP
jgi:hypothetical protein